MPRCIVRSFASLAGFPYRNEALGRNTKAAEESFLEDGGYGAIIEELKQAA